MNTLSSLRAMRRLLLVAVMCAVLAACASMGRPEGGPRDEEPPVFVSANPKPGSVNFNGNKLTLTFDENVSVDDPMTKVVVSPAQRTPPAISANGRHVTVEIRDTLQPSTTYTVDFADAIKDLNESNVLDGFAIDFSTGETIDTLRISGMLLEARTLEPAQGVLVGVYSNLSDTAIRTLPFERISKTNQLGQFTLRNLKEGTYRIYAVNDMNRDYHWDRSEDVAFYDVTITPTASPSVFTDTIWKPNGEIDSVRVLPATEYLPNDILLTWFNEEYKSQYLQKHERPTQGTLTMEFGAPADTLPILKLLNTHRAGETADRWSILEATPGLDTLKYWITDTLLFGVDTLLMEARYLRTDTADMLAMTTDTIRFVDRNAKMRKRQEEKAAKEAAEKAEREAKKRVERAERLEKQRLERIANGEATEEDSIPITPESLITPEEVKALDFKLKSGGVQEVYLPMLFSSPTPIASIDTTMIHFSVFDPLDSVWNTLKAPPMERVSPMNPLNYKMEYAWEPGAEYQLEIDSAAIRDIFDLATKPISLKIKAKSLDEYSTLTFNISGLDGRPAVLEVLNGQDKPVKTVSVSPAGVAKAEYLAPGTYFARLFIDTDTNSVYTTGRLDSIQPEEVYYYPKKLTLKKNWGIEQAWDIYEVAVDMQKPQEIKKNKPKRKRGEEEARPTDEEDDEDEFFDDPFMRNATRNGLGTSGLNSNTLSRTGLRR